MDSMTNGTVPEDKQFWCEFGCEVRIYYDHIEFSDGLKILIPRSVKTDKIHNCPLLHYYSNYSASTNPWYEKEPYATYDRSYFGKKDKFCWVPYKDIERLNHTKIKDHEENYRTWRNNQSGSGGLLSLCNMFLTPISLIVLQRHPS